MTAIGLECLSLSQCLQYCRTQCLFGGLHTSDVWQWWISPLTLPHPHRAEGECSGNCSGRGGCVNGTCNCTGGWRGERCQLPVCPNDCYDSGVCNETHAVCVCDVGFTGEREGGMEGGRKRGEHEGKGGFPVPPLWARDCCLYATTPTCYMYLYSYTAIHYIAELC